MLSSYTVALIRQSTYFEEEIYKRKNNLKHFFEIKKKLKLYMFSTAKSVVHLATHG